MGKIFERGNKSNKSIRPSIKLTILMLTIILIVFIVYYNRPSCARIDTLAASLTVREETRPVIGINADTNHLNFGEVSPLSSVKRVVAVKYEHDAKVTVTGKGDLYPWIDISPQRFTLAADESQDVSFEVLVPENAPAGNYTGEIFFCFQE